MRVFSFILLVGGCAVEHTSETGVPDETDNDTSVIDTSDLDTDSDSDSDTDSDSDADADSDSDSDSDTDTVGDTDTDPPCDPSFFPSNGVTSEGPNNWVAVPSSMSIGSLNFIVGRVNNCAGPITWTYSAPVSAAFHVDGDTTVVEFFTPSGTCSLAHSDVIEQIRITQVP